MFLEGSTESRALRLTRPIHPSDRFPPHGSAHDFDGLVAPHVRCMVQAARRIVRSDDLAWDAVQETLIRIWRRGRLPVEARRVLLRLVVPGSLHVLRTLDRRRRHESIASTSVFSPARACDDPRCELERRESRVLVERAIASLAPQLREVFVLREFRDLDYEAIALRLGVPTGTVRSRLHRARNALRELLVSQEHPRSGRADAAPPCCVQGGLS